MPWKDLERQIHSYSIAEISLVLPVDPKIVQRRQSSVSCLREIREGCHGCQERKCLGLPRLKNIQLPRARGPSIEENEGLIMCICKRVKTSFKEKEI